MIAIETETLIEAAIAAAVVAETTMITAEVAAEIGTTGDGGTAIQTFSEAEAEIETGIGVEIGIGIEIENAALHTREIASWTAISEGRERDVLDICGCCRCWC